MDSQAQLHRTHGHHQAEEPIRIHHPEEEEHHEKGPAKVVKKVKEKAKKIKKALTKHGHGHEHDRGEHITDDHDRGEHIPDDHDLDEEDDEEDQELHGGAPARGKAHSRSPDPLKEEIVPPGTKFYPVVSSSHSHSKPCAPIRGGEPVGGPNVSHGHEALSQPVKPHGVSEKEERRGAATLTPHNTPVSLLPAAPGGGTGSLGGGMSNYQCKITDPTGKAAGEIGAASALAALARRTGTGEDDQLGHGRDVREKSHGFDTISGPDMGKHLPAGDHGSRFPARRSHESGADFPTRTQGVRNPEGFDSKAAQERRRDGMQQPNQTSYTDKIASATSVVADKAVATKNAVASKLGYSGESGDGGHHEGRVQGAETPGSAGGLGYGNKVKETGAGVMTKLPFSGGGTGTETEAETHQVQEKGVSVKGYMSEKLSPGEEDKALSEVVAEKLHLGGGGGGENTKRGTVTQSEEVEKRLGGFTDQRSGEAMKHGEAFAEEGQGGMVDKLRGAVTSWISGTTDEVMQKSTESVQDSSQSVGATVGNMGFSGSGADGAGQRSGDKRGSVPVQSRFHDSGK